MSQDGERFTVALPVHRGRISPLFDTARRALLVEIDAGEERSRREVDLSDDGCRCRLSRLRAEGVEALVCGAISNRSLNEALCLGLRVWFSVAGEAEEVVASLVSTGGLDKALAMPGASAAPRHCHDLAWAGVDGPPIWGWHVGTALPPLFRVESTTGVPGGHGQWDDSVADQDRA